MKYKILHLPTATYVYTAKAMDCSDVFYSEYEISQSMYLSGNSICIFNDRSAFLRLMEIINYEHPPLRERNEYISFYEVEFDKKYYNPVFPEHFELIEVEDDNV